MKKFQINFVAFCYVAVILVFFMSLSNGVWAEDPQSDNSPKIDVQMGVQKEVAKLEDGKPLLAYESVETAKKGDVLLYTMEYRNAGKTAASDASVIGPIPKETVYMGDSATGENAKITYSIDDGATFHVPPIPYTVRKPDGTVEKKTATPDMYTHIRFTIKQSLNPGQTGQLKFKVTIK